MVAWFVYTCSTPCLPPLAAFGHRQSVEGPKIPRQSWEALCQNFIQETFIGDENSGRYSGP